ncbi:hypothetical protein [Nostoc sp.]|uniref:hypothetical protein n=1 Tax=Nostoc sp. TaxID=1180 RepID=UPI002FFB6208
MRYKIISRGVGARQCRAPTGVPHTNEKRYSAMKTRTDILGSRKTKRLAAQFRVGGIKPEI